MNFGQGLKKLAVEFNLSIKFNLPRVVNRCQPPPLPSPPPPAIACALTKGCAVTSTPTQTYINESFYRSQGSRISSILCYNVGIAHNGIKSPPLTSIKSIIDPDVYRKGEIDAPQILDIDLSLPATVHQDKVDRDTGKSPILLRRKRFTTNMLIIRRRKMRKHKRKKFRLKHKFAILKVKKAREMAKEVKFQGMLRDILQAGEQFSPEKDLDEKFKVINWERPVTRARGRLAPQYVVKQELEKSRLKKILDERVEECLKETSKP